jgi:hypothetical protein
MLVIDLGRFGASIFDLDGVITRTASVHARAWKRLFDEFLAQQAAQTGTPFVPFNLETDYQRYVDGKPRVAGVPEFSCRPGYQLAYGGFWGIGGTGNRLEAERRLGVLPAQIAVFEGCNEWRSGGSRRRFWPRRRRWASRACSRPS